ncbi:hypothetical protein [Yinghuangia soli]|uniref:Uncharacterized protein n=1 Tax=Yinghuangia soli TaxID=2908204 RepID=A0AA41U221_9ACTN|nr:hypothetical protein [Yinghuangia soli]MCF2530220.1 hypothetical protein [Yinghuangia soli]
MTELPRPRTEPVLPASSPFDCWVDFPAALRRHDEMAGAERARALADWVEDVGAMNLATELLRTREVVAVLVKLLKARGVDPVEAHKRATAAARGQVS